MKKLDLSRANAPLADYVLGLDAGPLVLTRRGKPVAALVPVEGVDLETLAVGTNPEFLDLIARSRKRMAEEGALSSQEVRRLFGVPNGPGRKRKIARPKVSGKR
jgi:antitoxin (DNA-binding transcriptional repressor) of toxin-antitoxin stability system